MPNPGANVPTHRFAGRDGVMLAWHEMGEGRPLVLLHGLFSNALTNWVRFGTAARLAAAGHRLIMADLRGHGDSAKPHDAAHWPPDILVDDGLALIEALDLEDYDLGGYSLGARTAMRMLVRGARPARTVVGGMGLAGMLDTGARADHFRRVLSGIGRHPRGSDAWLAEAFLKSNGGDPLALLPLLDSFVDTPEADLRAVATPTLVVAGTEDDDNGSAEALAALVHYGKYRAIPGNHMSAVTRPELAQAMIDFLNG